MRQKVSYCKTAKHLWNNVKQWVAQKTGKNIVFTLENIILNDITKKPIDSINMICLVVKQYIYSARCLRTIPNFQILKQTTSSSRSNGRPFVPQNRPLTGFFKPAFRSSHTNCLPCLVLGQCYPHKSQL